MIVLGQSEIEMMLFIKAATLQSAKRRVPATLVHSTGE
jgi:hypothetical protein